MRRIATILAILAIAGCAPAPRQIAVVADSMGTIDPTVVQQEIQADGDHIVRYHAVPGATTWTHPDITSELWASDVDTIVVDFGLNEVRYLRGDSPLTQMTLSQVLASWNTVKNQAAQNGKCLVWVNTQTATPLHTYPTSYYIGQLNTWIANNTHAANWRDPVNNNIWNNGGTWVSPDGFHPQTGSYGPHAWGSAIRDAVGAC